MTGPKIAITGLGAVSPLGLNCRQLWDNLCAGNCGISTITAFDPSDFECKIAGQAPPEFNVRDFVPKAMRKTIKLMSRDIELAVAASWEAFESSGHKTQAIDPENITIRPSRTAISIGAGLISCDLCEIAPAVANCMSNGEFDLHKWGSEGMQQITPLWLLKYLPNMLACHVGIIHDIQGPGNNIICAEVAGHLSINEAAQIIARGDADLAIAGGGEAKVNPLVHTRQILINRANTKSNDNPHAACRPFDANANGCIFGEAAGLVILEKLDDAKNRNADIYAIFAGAGQSTNLSPKWEKLESDGKGIQIAIENALADAGVKPQQIDLIIPHGTGIAADDSAESTAIYNALGAAAEKIPCLPTKSMLSNTGAAAGALDIIIAAMIIKNGKIPAAKNCEKKAAGCRLNINTKPVEKNINYALVCGYTYGGQTAAVILKALT